MLREALKTVEGKGVEINIFTLHGRKIEDCLHCNWCMTEQTEDEFCALKDGLEELFPMVVKADALMVASPVYLGRLSGHLASVLDRLRCIHYGRHYAGGMKHKIGAAIAVSWFRNSGIETTLTSVHWAFLSYQMLIAVPGSSICTFGGAGLSSLSGTGKFDPNDKHQVIRDEYGLKGARATAKSMLELTKIIRAGKEIL